jgi:hypothetical protein
MSVIEILTGQTETPRTRLLNDRVEQDEDNPANRSRHSTTSKGPISPNRVSATHSIRQIRALPPAM